ncbi:hypothetical protein KTS45_12475 [Halomicroarcula limicola]|uniref:Uncharacterized protein n=1 Tax=Haloarcula limicola TaxID=1429915 RepID=A0A8J7Y6M1_9EURY|nr:hypothetical protein [Halomicroarcula limicola]MBV0925012.1 hypothetical protein [Halomicroarcula limicola]
MIGELLHALGVSGSIVTVVSAAVMFYHGREVLSVLTRVGAWVRIGAVFAFVAVALSSGLVPGVDVSLNLETLWSWLSGVASSIPIREIWLPETHGH